MHMTNCLGGRRGRDVLWVTCLAPREVGAAEGELVYAGSTRDAEDGVAVVLFEDVVDESLVHV